MSAKCYSFTVGDVACAVLLDGVNVLGREGILKRFPDASEDDYRRAYAEIGLSLDEAISFFNILAARIGGETVLVDSGEGGRPKGGHLPAGLRLPGVEQQTITQGVITHTHGDHVMGLLTNKGDPVFPNASYVISKEEIAFWQGRIEEGTANHGPILAMMQQRGLRLIDMDEAILPGLTAVPIPGHTPGMIAVLIESGNERLIALADLLHSPMQFAHPEWSPTFDADTSLSVPTRRNMLGRAADENWLALFYHLPFPGLGRVRRAERGFAWEPVKSE